MMITGGVNPYTTRSMTKLYRIERYNGLNPKCLLDQVSLGRCRPSGCLSFQVPCGGDVFLPGRCPLLRSLAGRPQVSVGLLAGVLLGPELLVLVVTVATPESLGGVCQFWRTDHFCGLGCGQDWWVLLCIPGFPRLFVGELHEFPDLSVVKVDYKYHNFPFCSWVCLLSSKIYGTTVVLDSQNIRDHCSP